MVPTVASEDAVLPFSARALIAKSMARNDIFIAWGGTSKVVLISPGWLYLCERKFYFEMQLSVIRKLYEKIQTFKPERP
ncbi:hypothetical protein HZA42_05440 [Candidatus Peregrinibacteria bacterium]|nr:hypothetical protein [Candidatus Peregrinibacteria bacterium]